MANKQFKVPINLVNLASDPGTASEGDIYYNTTSDSVKVYANSAWASIGSGGGSTSLDGVTDVTITSVADNEVLAYDSASSLWINQTASEAGLATTSGNLSQFAATTSSQLLGVISDETGTGALVFGTSPTFTTSVIGGATFSAFATTNNLTFGNSSGYTNLTATNNILSGGTIEANTANFTVTDNYSSRNLYGNDYIANYIINIGNGTYTSLGEAGEVNKTINIGTTSKAAGVLSINLGTQYGFTNLYGNVLIDATSITIGNVNETEISYLNGVTSAIQTQLNSKAPLASPTFTGTVQLGTSATFVVEGATDNTFETTLTVDDPTADRTITFPNATGTVALTSDLSSYAALSGATFTGAVSGTSLTLSGDLTVNGTTTTINSTTLTVDDKNIELGSVVSPTNTTADGGGITLKGTTDKTFNWVNSTSAWTSSEHISLGTGKNLLLNGATSGTITITPTAISGTNTITLPALTGTVALIESPTFTGTVTIPTLNLTNPLGYAYGGTGLTTLGTAGQVLKVNAGGTAIEWGTVSGGSSFTNSAELAALINDETGFSSSAKAVFSISPTFTTSILGGTTFSAFATTDNLTIGESNGYTVDGTFTNNVLSGGNVSDSVSLLTLTDNYSVRNLVSTVNDVNHTINIGTGSITNNANYATKNINIGTGTILYDGNTYITIGATGATIDINATTLSIGGTATTLAIGSTSTATKTLNLFNGATVSGATKTINIGTQGVSGSTTNINIGSSVSGSGGTVTISESLSLSESVSIAASKNIAVASHYSGSFGTGRVVMTGTGSNPTTRPDGTSLVAGDVWIAY